MLVISRKAQERIKIGDNIEVVVTRIKGGRVQIGIQADKSVKVLRGELKEKSSGKDIAHQGEA